MRKNRELENADSCINRALPDEFVFVYYLGVIPLHRLSFVYGVLSRINSGKNRSADPEIIEALQLADNMEAEQIALRAWLGK